MNDLFDNAFTVAIIPICFLVVGYIGWFLFRNVGIDLWPAVSFFLFIAPIILPIFLYRVTMSQWMDFVQNKFKYNAGRVVLRLRLPPEVLKSPEAMESVFENIHAPNPSDNLHQAFIDGKSRQWMTCELVSIGGQVRFYMTVHKKIKDLLEAQLYAEYPGIEIIEEDIDYAAEVQWNPDEMDLMSFHFVKKKDDVMPIRTYIDYGHDRMPKEEEKFSPMSATIEYLGRAKPHERIFIQILCRPHRDGEWKFGDGGFKADWKEAAKKKIDEIMGRGDDVDPAEEEAGNVPRRTLTAGERDTVAAIERNVSKLAFDTAVRGMYITLDKTQFDGNKISALISTLKQYEVIGRNGFGIRWKTDFDYMMFEDPFEKRKTARKILELNEYKKRNYFPGLGKVNEIHHPKVMSVEELATMFHIPGSSIITPSLDRVPATMGTAPGNLPTGLPQE